MITETNNLKFMFVDEGSGSGEFPSSGSKESSGSVAATVKLKNEDKCEPNPCQNGGTCITNYNLIDGYKCQCADDYGGITCAGRSKPYEF